MGAELEVWWHWEVWYGSFGTFCLTFQPSGGECEKYNTLECKCVHILTS